jgi:hypothetical protein
MLKDPLEGRANVVFIECYQMYLKMIIPGCLE